MIKKLVFSVTISLLIVALVACGSKKPATSADPKSTDLITHELLGLTLQLPADWQLDNPLEKGCSPESCFIDEGLVTFEFTASELNLHITKYEIPKYGATGILEFKKWDLQQFIKYFLSSTGQIGQSGKRDNYDYFEVVDNNRQLTTTSYFFRGADGFWVLAFDCQTADYERLAPQYAQYLNTLVLAGDTQASQIGYSYLSAKSGYHTFKGYGLLFTVPKSVKLSLAGNADYFDEDYGIFFLLKSPQTIIGIQRYDFNPHGKEFNEFLPQGAAEMTGQELADYYFDNWGFSKNRHTKGAIVYVEQKDPYTAYENGKETTLYNYLMTAVIKGPHSLWIFDLTNLSYNSKTVYSKYLQWLKTVEFYD